MAHRSVRRNELIHEMERLYIDRAYSDSELAERLGVNRSTVYRTRVFMENELHLPFLSEAPGRYRLDRQKQLGSMQVHVGAAWAIAPGPSLEMVQRGPTKRARASRPDCAVAASAPARAVGSQTYPPLEEAPGSYVKVRV